MNKGESEVQPPLHAARVAADPPLGGLGQTDPLKQLLGASSPLGAGDALQRGLENEMLAPGEDRIEGGLLQRGADGRADLRALADDVVAADRRASARRRKQR